MRTPHYRTFLVVLAMAGVARAASDEVRVPRWQAHDFAFRSAAKPDNPFQVPFSATVRRPDGKEFLSLGFYDGEGTWKLRLAPDSEGAWSLVTHSSVADLDGKHVSFVCAANRNPGVHGAVRVDPKHPRHFVCEDGSRWFPMGYECDWLWALDTNDRELKTLNPFLDKLAAHGFNFVILNAYAHDCGWRKGKTGPDDYGPPPMYAWAGSNEKPDHSRFNLAYWQHYDRVIEALYRRGIVAHVMIKVYNKQVQWPAKGSPQDDLYFQWLAARYAAYPNVHWDFSKEANNEKDLEYKLGRIRLLRECDPYRRLVTNHDDKATYNSGAYDKVLDYRCDQQHSKWHETLLAHRARCAWPVINVEFGYEHGPAGINDKTYGVVQAPEEVCRRAWEICMAGGYVAYYYTYTAWDVIRPQDTPPGYAYFKRLRDFFETTGYWLMEPADELVSEGYCLANPGKEYVVFLNRAKPFTLKLAGLAEPLPAEWYQPLSGKRLPGGRLGAGEHRLQPPADWGAGPVVLHVGTPPAGDWLIFRPISLSRHVDAPRPKNVPVPLRPASGGRVIVPGKTSLIHCLGEKGRVVP